MESVKAVWLESSGLKYVHKYTRLQCTLMLVVLCNGRNAEVICHVIIGQREKSRMNSTWQIWWNETNFIVMPVLRFDLITVLISIKLCSIFNLMILSKCLLVSKMYLSIWNCSVTHGGYSYGYRSWFIHTWMLYAASGKGIHRPLKSKHDKTAGHQYRAQVSLLLFGLYLNRCTSLPEFLSGHTSENLLFTYYKVFFGHYVQKIYSSAQLRLWHIQLS